MNKLAITTVLITIGACKWTQFDDQETEAWVHSTTKPNSDSSDYGIAMIAGGVGTDPAGDRLVVLGAGQALYSELNYKPDGSADLVGTNEVKLNNEFAISTFDTQPILLHEPTTNEISLVVNSGGGSVAVLSGVHMLMQRQIFNPKNASPDAATYVKLPPSGTTPASPLLVVATQDTVYGSPNIPNTPASVCRLVDADGTTPVSVIALGTSSNFPPPDSSDEVVVWSSTGKLYVYQGSVADASGCNIPGTGTPPGPSAAMPIAPVVDTGFVPARFSQMHIIDRRYAILVAHMADSAATSQIMMYDLQANDGAGGRKLALVGQPISHPGQRSSTVLTVDSSHRFLAVGYPAETIDNTASGQVILYTISTTAGLDSNPAETLSDAQPESNELFGRALATFTFNGHQILAVGADNEVFAYYRTNLYGETRAQ